MNKARLKVFASGIFYSKLQYCLPVFGNVFGLEKYRDTNNKFSSFTKSDNKKLQVLQNSLNRMLTESDYNTPEEDFRHETFILHATRRYCFFFHVHDAETGFQGKVL